MRDTGGFVQSANAVTGSSRPSLGLRGWLATGAATVVLSGAFVAGGLGGVVHSTAAAALLVLLPAAALSQQLPPDFDLRRRRLEAYASSIVVLTVLGLAALWLAQGLRAEPGAWLSLPPSLPGNPPGGGAGPGQGGIAAHEGVLPPGGWPAPGSWPTLLAAAGVLVAGGLLVLYTFKAASPFFGWTERDVVRQIMPTTPPEKGVFALLAVAAGVFEEIVFRGFLPAFLLPWTGSYLLAALPAAVAFGISHAYQGSHGMLRTGVLGLWLAFGVGWTGSLWPSIFAHAALDLLIGLALAPSLVGSPQDDPPPST